MNGSLVSIPFDIISKMRAWNTDMFRNDSNYDSKIVHALLVLSLGSDEIIAGNIPDKVLKFVKGKIRNCVALNVHRTSFHLLDPFYLQSSCAFVSAMIHNVLDGCLNTRRKSSSKSVKQETIARSESSISIFSYKIYFIHHSLFLLPIDMKQSNVRNERTLSFLR